MTGLYTVVIPNEITKQLPFNTKHHTVSALEQYTIHDLLAT